MFGQHAHSRLLGKRRRSCARSRRAGGIKAKLLTFLALLLILAGVLPIIVAKTPLRGVLLSSALPRDSVSVTIGDASLSWFSSPSLSTVEVKDTAGDALLVAESIKIDRTPLSLALNSHNLGTIQVVRPVIHVKVRPDGSNLEDVLQKLVPSAPENAPKVESSAKKQRRSYFNSSKQRFLPTTSPLVANGACRTSTHSTIRTATQISASVRSRATSPYPIAARRPFLPVDFHSQSKPPTVVYNNSRFKPIRSRSPSLSLGCAVTHPAAS